MGAFGNSPAVWFVESELWISPGRSAVTAAGATVFVVFTCARHNSVFSAVTANTEIDNLAIVESRDMNLPIGKVRAQQLTSEKVRFYWLRGGTRGSAVGAQQNPKVWLMKCPACLRPIDTPLAASDRTE